MNEEFETIGLGKARMQLTDLAKFKIRRYGDEKKYKIVEELYVEIRAARLAGASWNKIRKALVLNVDKFNVSIQKLENIFHDIDVKFEKETGEPALPVVVKHYKKGEQIGNETCLYSASSSRT